MKSVRLFIQPFGDSIFRSSAVDLGAFVEVSVKVNKPVRPMRALNFLHPSGIHDGLLKKRIEQ
jgi:hypothetical protein